MAQIDSRSGTDLMKSVTWILLWCLAHTLTMSVAKTLDPALKSGLGVVMLVFVRVLAGNIVFAPFVMKNGLSSFKTKRFPLHLIRILLSCLAMGCTYYAYCNLDLAFMTAIGFSAPLITTMLSVFFFKDRVTPAQWMIVIIGYLGVLMVVQPFEQQLEPAVIVAILANVFASMTIATMKKLTETESSVTMLLYSNLGLLVVSGILASIFWQTPSDSDLQLLAMMGVTATFSQYCYITAIRHGRLSFVAPFEYTRLVYAVPIGFYFFDEIPTVWTLAGGLVIIMCNYLITHIERQREQEKQTKKAA